MMGTGLRPLGDELIGPYFQNPKERSVVFFITHTHWDHIQGLPFFKPIYFKDYTLKFFSPYSDLQSRLERQQSHEFFPVPLSGTSSKKEFKLFLPGEVLQFPSGLRVESFPLKHPGVPTPISLPIEMERFSFLQPTQNLQAQIWNLSMMRLHFFPVLTYLLWIANILWMNPFLNLIGGIPHTQCL